MENKWIELFKSRKFWASLIGMAFVFLGEKAGATPEQITDAVYLIVSFVLGLAYVDGQKAR